jgi:hypothetical protein
MVKVQLGNREVRFSAAEGWLSVHILNKSPPWWPERVLREFVPLPVPRLVIRADRPLPVAALFRVLGARPVLVSTPGRGMRLVHRSSLRRQETAEGLDGPHPAEG